MVFRSRYARLAVVSTLVLTTAIMLWMFRAAAPQSAVELPTLALLPSLSPSPSTTPESLAALPTAPPLAAETQPAAVQPVSIVPQPPLPDLQTTTAPNIQSPPPPAPDQQIIRFAPGTSSEDRAAWLASVGAVASGEITALNTVLAIFPAGSPSQLPPSPWVVASEPNHYVSAQDTAAVSTDPYSPQQWGLQAVNAPVSWPTSATPVTVAVIDSGVNTAHPDLYGRILPGYDYVQQDTDPQDEYGHGTSVTAIIAANTNNAEGIAGVAPNASILPLRVLDASGFGTYADVAAAIIYAADHGAQVINLSLGGQFPSDLLQAAVDYATSRGILVIAAAGNHGAERSLYPAAYPAVLSIGAVDSALQRSIFSAYGTSVDFYAPGQDIWTASRDGGYTIVNGTSFAAAYASGVAALEIAQGRSLSASAGGVIFAGSVAEQPPTIPPELPAGTPTPSPDLPPEYVTLLDRVRAQGRLRVIVGLNTAFRPEGLLDAQAAVAQQADIASAQAGLLSSLAAYPVEVTADYQYIPFIALDVDESALLALFANPQVTSVSEDNILFPTAIESNIDLIDADNAWVTDKGYNGTGQTVAVIDSGVQASHPAFGGRVIAEACFSSRDTVNNTYQSTCAGNVTSLIGPNAAAPCTLSGCDHGTHVAGSAVGIDIGVAPGANLIAIKAMTQHNSSQVCGGGGSCVLFFDANVISALEYVYSLRTTYSIAAVNMSLGAAQQFPQYCDSYASTVTNGSIAYKAIIDNLAAADIATVISSGNESFTGGVGYPACISTAITVGSVNNPGVNTVSGFSNSSPIVDLLAPGGNIRSSVPTNLYTVLSGTSMASPHVTGAFAILRQYAPTAPLDRLFSALQTTGVQVTDPRNNITKPRIDVDNALNLLIGGATPERPRVLINELDTAATSSIEVTNRSASSVTLTGWRLQTYNASGAIEMDYAFPPGTTIPASAYLRIIEGTGTNTSTALYTGTAITGWTTGGAVVLRNSTLAADFVRFGTSTVASPTGTNWMGNNPAFPLAGQTLGRDGQSTDGDLGANWFSQSPSPGTVNSVPAPSNDLIAGATSISLPYNVVQNTTLATYSASDPSAILQPECRVNTRSVWFTYTPPVNQTVRFLTAGSDYDTFLSVYVGPANSLTYVACNDDAGSGVTTSSLTVALTGGTTYYIMANGGLLGETGFLNLQAQALTVPGNDARNGAFVVASLPYTTTANNDLATDADPADPLPSCPSNSYTLWYTYTAPDSRPIRISTIGSDFDTLVTVFRWTGSALQEIACNDDAAGGFQSQLDVPTTQGSQYYIMIASGSGGGPVNNDTGNLLLSIDYAPNPPANDEYTGATQINTLPYTTSQANASAFLNASDPDPSCDFEFPGFDYAVDKTVWYRFTPASSIPVRVNTAGSGFSTLVAIFTNPPTFTQIACDDGFSGQADLTFTATAGTTYYIMIGGTADNKSGTVQLNVSQASPTATPTHTPTRTPTITRTPTATPTATLLPAPALVSPANNTVASAPQPVFTWAASSGAVAYQVALDTVNPPVSTSANIQGTSYTAPVVLQGGIRYYWRVRAINSGGPSPWSAVRVIFGQSPAGAPPLLNIFSTSTPTLSWNRITWADAYEVQVDNSAAFTTPEFVSGILPSAALSVNITTLPNGTYFWRVRARNSAGVWQSWSSATTFTIQTP